MNIDRSMRLSRDGYYQSEYKKTAITLHHTVGGSARSTYHHWERDGKHIATSYIIGRDGTIYELFDPTFWSWHLGIKGTNGYHDKRTIGIELASVGPLIYDEGKYYSFDRVTSSTLYKDEVFDSMTIVKHACKWRGWRFFAQYTEVQMESLKDLLQYLNKEFDIRLEYPADPMVFSRKVPTFGVYPHSRVRADKSDVHLGFDWNVVSGE